MKNTANQGAGVQSGATVAVFGLGAVGLAVIEAAAQAGASRIFAIDTNPEKFARAQEWGATECINPKDLDQPVQAVIVQKTEYGVDYSFDCTGNVQVRQRVALALIAPSAGGSSR